MKLDLDERLQPGWRGELERAWVARRQPSALLVHLELEGPRRTRHRLSATTHSRSSRLLVALSHPRNPRFHFAAGLWPIRVGHSSISRNQAASQRFAFVTASRRRTPLPADALLSGPGTCFSAGLAGVSTRPGRIPRSSRRPLDAGTLPCHASDRRLPPAPERCDRAAAWLLRACAEDPRPAENWIDLAEIFIMMRGIGRAAISPAGNVAGDP